MCIRDRLNDGYLTISATVNRDNDEKDSDGKYIRRERFSGSFNRSFYVGEDAVSYTHLLQWPISSGPKAIRKAMSKTVLKTLLLTLPTVRPKIMPCLLYTSRCV